MKDKLAIIGNGFDISHGLKTGYLDFANTLPVDIKKDWEKILIESEVHPNTWYSFEDAIDKITAKWQENIGCWCYSPHCRFFPANMVA